MSENFELLDLTAEIISAFVENNRVATGELASLIASTYAALASLGQEAHAPAVVQLVPAVPIKKSVTRDAIICLEDGKAFKSLKRHLSAKYRLTPEQYREKWGLPHDYPMTAPSYTERRSALAKSMGLGRSASKTVTPSPKLDPAPKRKRGRPAAS